MKPEERKSSTVLTGRVWVFCSHFDLFVLDRIFLVALSENWFQHRLKNRVKGEENDSPE